MKKLLIAFVFIGFGMHMHAQEVTDVQWTQIQKRTADWCPKCGDWGWSFKESLLETYADEPVLIWSTHLASSGLKSTTSVELVNNYGGSGQPLFFLNGANLQVNSGNLTEKLNLVNQNIEGNALFAPFYGSGADAEYDGTTISVNARAEFFEPSGLLPVYMGIYLIRKETVAFQQSQGANAVHKNLVINHFTDAVFGEELVASNGAAGSEYFVSGALEMPGEDITNYNVVSILWSKDADGYIFLNANVQEISMSSNVADKYLQDTKIKVLNATDTEVNINIESGKNQSNGIITVFDLSGNLIITSEKVISQGTNAITLNVNNIPSGMYIVNLSIGNKTKSERFLKN